MSLHPFTVIHQPPLRTKDVRVGAESGFVAMHDPAIDRDHCIGRNKNVIDGGAVGRYVSLNVQADSRTETHGFIEAGLKEREALGRSVGE